MEPSRVAFARSNGGPAACCSSGSTLLTATGGSLTVQDEQLNLRATVPFHDAFPGAAGASICAVTSCDDLVAAASEHRVAFFNLLPETRTGKKHKVHSTLSVSYAINSLHMPSSAACLVVGERTLSLWTLIYDFGLPVWERRAGYTLPDGTTGGSERIQSAQLSPSGSLIALVPAESNTVLVLRFEQPHGDKSRKDKAKEGTLRLVSKAVHARNVRDAGWRPSKTSLAESDQILFTSTTDSVFRVWGCMIDEPLFFSLWLTLSVPSSSTTGALKTIYMSTTKREIDEEDLFLHIMRDGSVWEVVVQGFSRRPPSLLTMLPPTLSQGPVIPAPLLPKLRYVHLLHAPDAASDEPDSGEWTIVGRCGRGTVLSLPLVVRDADESRSGRVIMGTAKAMDVNMTAGSGPLGPGEVPGRKRRKLAASLEHDSIISLASLSSSATKGASIQAWKMKEFGFDLAEEDDEEERDGGFGFAARWDIADDEGDCAVANWDHRYYAVATVGHVRLFRLLKNGCLRLIDTLSAPQVTSVVSITAFIMPFDVSGTLLFLVTAEQEIVTLEVDSEKKLHLLFSQALMEDAGSVITHIVPVPVNCDLDDRRSSVTALEEARMMSISAAGDLSIWELDVPPASTAKWGRKARVKTRQADIVIAACNAAAKMAVVAPAGTPDRKGKRKQELSIWDSKESRFATGQEHAWPLDADAIDLTWSEDSSILCLVTSEKVHLLCAQRLDDLTGQGGWTVFATLDPSQITGSPAASSVWLTTSTLSVESGDHVFFYSPKSISAGSTKARVSAVIDPLPYHHPQLLYQCLLHGKLPVVVKVLKALARQVTSDGTHTPDEDNRGAQTFSLADFFSDAEPSPAGAPGTRPAPSGDLFSALTGKGERQAEKSPANILSDDDANRLRRALDKPTFLRLSGIERDHLKLVIQAVLEVQLQQSSLDTNGFRYLVSMRSFFIYNSANGKNGETSLPRLKYRDIVWASRSESQDILLEASVKASDGRLTWTNAKALGVFMWLKSKDEIIRQMEAVGRTEFMRPNSDERDPIMASIFYLALKKRHVVLTFWKQASFHGDQKLMLKFLLNDFDDPRWKTAASKNAFSVMSKQRFLFAAMLFLLGGNLKDAVSVCVRQLDDFQLAIAICRTYEGDDGPVYKSLLENTVIPLAFKEGYRWLAFWAFWELNRRDLAVQAIVTPLRELASTIPFAIDDVGSLRHEDPSLVLLLSQVRSWSLQTLRGAASISEATEYGFILHVSRILYRMGCHVLALALLRNYKFMHAKPDRPQRSVLHGRMERRSSLLLHTTKLDVSPSNLPSRAPSPEIAPAGRRSGSETRPEKEKEAYHSAVKEVKKQVVAVPDFDMSSFGF